MFWWFRFSGVLAKPLSVAETDWPTSGRSQQRQTNPPLQPPPNRKVIKDLVFETD